jgi:hypothetical protein
MSLFGAPMSKSVMPLLCWGSDSLVSVSAILRPRVSPLPLLLLPPLRLRLLRRPPRWPGVVVWHLGHLSLPPLYPVISVNPPASSPCYLLQPRRWLPLCLERHRLRVLGWSRSSHPLYPLWSWDSSSSTPTVPSVQMGSPTSIDSPGDLTPMQVDVSGHSGSPYTTSTLPTPLPIVFRPADHFRGLLN